MDTPATFLSMLRDIKTVIPYRYIDGLDWVPGGRESQWDLKLFKNRTAAAVLDKMMKYISERVIDGDICELPKETFIYMGRNFPLAIERMRKKPDYPYTDKAIPGYIRICSKRRPRMYLSLLMRAEDRKALIDKINGGMVYHQPIPYNHTWHLERYEEERDAWERIQNEGRCNDLTWKI